MRHLGTELVAVRTVRPGRVDLELLAPAAAAGPRPGQVMAFIPPPASGIVLRRPAPIVAADAVRGVVSVHVAPPPDAAGWFSALRAGDRVDVAGPLGRPFELDPRSRHLLLVADGDGIASLRFLAADAVRDGRSVVLLAGARTARDVPPSSLLPDEVEYVVATADGSLGTRGTVLDRVLDYEAWADQAFGAGSLGMLGALVAVAAGRRARLGVAVLGRKRGGGRQPQPGTPEARRRAFLQVAVPHDLACALATCLGCVLPATDGGTARACRDGPVFASDELEWGPAA